MLNKDPRDESDKPYDKSIRKRLTRTVLIPSVTLLVLWIAVSSYFLFNGVYVRLVAASVREVSIPAATALAVSCPAVAITGIAATPHSCDTSARRPPSRVPDGTIRGKQAKELYAAVRGAGDPGSAMDVDPDGVVAAERRAPGRQPLPGPDAVLAGPTFEQWLNWMA